MRSDSREQYIRDLESRAVEPAEVTQFVGRRRWWSPAAAELLVYPRRKLLLAWAAPIALALALFVAHDLGRTTVHGDLIMINSGATDTIDCNGGNLKLDGDKNQYTVTGHCRRLEVFGSENRVTVDSAETISAFGDDNVMIYRSGSPRITKTGNNNIVGLRPGR